MELVATMFAAPRRSNERDKYVLTWRMYPRWQTTKRTNPELLAGCVSRTTQKFLWPSFCLIGLLSTILGCSKTELEPMDGQESEQNHAGNCRVEFPEEAERHVSVT